MSTRERDRRAVGDDAGDAVGGRERGAREESDDATAYERRDDGDGDGDGEEAAEAGGGQRARLPISVSASSRCGETSATAPTPKRPSTMAGEPFMMGA